MAKQHKTATPKAAKKRTLPLNNAASFTLPLWAAALLFAATTLIFFGSQIMGNTYFWEDFTEYVYPAQVFAAKYLQQGEIPFWNPYTFSGTPFLADVAIGFFYPPNMLQALFVQNGKLPVWIAQMVIIAHFVLAQFSMFLFMRNLKVSDAGALISAVSYGFTSYAVCHVFHPMMIAHCAWFPLAWMYFRQALLPQEMSQESFQQRLYFSLLSGLVLGIMMLSGHPQTTLYLVLLLFFYTLWAFGVQITDKSASASNPLHYGISAALPILIGAGIFAVQLLHSQEFAAYSERTDFSIEKASVGALQLSQIFTLIVPKLFGYAAATQATETLSVPFYLANGNNFYYWETAFYVGIPALMLGLVGFLTTLRSRERENIAGLMLFASVFAVLFALGTNGFLFELMFKLPLFDRFRIPSRMLIVVVLGLTIMAGIGFDELWKRRGTAFRLKAAGIGLPILMALGLAITVPPEAGNYADAVKGFGLTALIIASLTGVLLLLLERGLVSATVAGISVMVLAFADLYIAGSSFNQNKANPAEQYERTNAAIPPSMRADTMPPDSLFRVSMRTQGAMLMPRNQGLYSPVMLFEGYMPILIGRRLPFAPTGEETFDLLNIRLAVALDSTSGSAYLRERPSAFPRARMLYDAVQSAPEQAGEIAKSGKINFATQAILEKPLAITLPKQAPEAVSHKIHCTKYRANSMQYDVETAENGILALSEIWYPAWKATIDGQETEVLRINYSLRGVAVPKGKHTIALRYDSTPFRTGAWISLATLVAACTGIVLLRRTQTANKAHNN
ncbi:MAG: YfhO family protein [Candidatus Kapabacteria bacterium]|jgi:hypothetical protein|nr:YfhO family protein [Candidatus Kapabacteria bacterium]